MAAPRVSPIRAAASPNRRVRQARPGARSSSLTPLLAGINPVVQTASDTASYVWLKSNATADVQARAPRRPGSPPLAALPARVLCLLARVSYEGSDCARLSAHPGVSG